MKLNSDIAVNSAATGAATPAGDSSRTWTVAKVMDAARHRSERSDGQLVEIFTVIDDLANRADREARAFIQSLPESAAEFEPSVRELAVAAHLGLAAVGPWMLLLRGAASGLLIGDLDAAAHARRFVRLLVAERESAAITHGFVDDFDLDYASTIDPSGPLLMAGAQSTSHEHADPFEPRGELVVPVDDDDQALARAEIADWLATLDDPAAG